MKRVFLPNGRRHGLRAKSSLDRRVSKTVLTYESRAKIYCWTTGRDARPVIKH